MNKKYEDSSKFNSDENIRCFIKKSKKQSDLTQNQNDEFIETDSESDNYESQIVFNENELSKSQNFDTNKEYSFKIYCKRYKHFIDSPRVHFVYETVFYSIFLAFFSFMLLCEFEYYQKNTQLSTHLEFTTNSSSYTDFKLVKYPSYSEYIIIFWWLMYVIEEFRQVTIWLI